MSVSGLSLQGMKQYLPACACADGSVTPARTPYVRSLKTINALKLSQRSKLQLSGSFYPKDIHILDLKPYAIHAHPSDTRRQCLRYQVRVQWDFRMQCPRAQSAHLPKRRGNSRSLAHTMQWMALSGVLRMVHTGYDLGTGAGLHS